MQAWQENRKKFDMISQQAFDTKHFQDMEEARESVRGLLVSIQDRYPMLETLVREIAERAHRYTARTREKIAYYLNADQSIYSDVLRIMDALSHADQDTQTAMTHMAGEGFPISVAKCWNRTAKRARRKTWRNSCA